ncbi:hypothetical protein EOPP23_10560 [Endozoicomonas sp. OPT23]|uniref:AmmeMemoRadiSam system protein A n=1 Tax=Endozoicomonas sp. OPT23 TaxID=2072845 RepID=UPI00129BC59C|nr:AmmeMemoRadiSam system protein A [Endozoicomonas sp. OPT23]MRI33426.1 hypothetical protein [Endozoicomonas sp. OPT23]
MAFSISASDQSLLLKLARNSITEGCDSSHASQVDLSELPSSLRIQCATFVTLQKSGELRGCIGSLKPQRTLAEDVVHNAFASAFSDSRFYPVKKEELADIQIEISVLSPMQAMDISSEEELLESIRPNIDGLLIQSSYHSATFLPQVWEQLPDPVEFLLHLKQKAGLQSDEWPEDMSCFRYQCFKFGE